MRAQQFSDAPPPLPNEVEKEYAEIKSTLRDVSKDVISFQKIFIPASDPQNPLATPDTQLTLGVEARQAHVGHGEPRGIRRQRAVGRLALGRFEFAIIDKIMFAQPLLGGIDLAADH